MNTDRPTEMIGAAVVGALINALILFITGYLATNGLCPPCFLPLPLFSPLLLSKFPLEMYSYIFGEYDRTEEKKLRLAAIAGGYIGQFLLICLLILAAIIFLIVTCSRVNYCY
jgi:hypothetical protein